MTDLLWRAGIHAPATSPVSGPYILFWRTVASRRGALACSVLLFTGACASVETYSESDKYVVSPDRPMPKGLSYGLPENMIRMTWQRTRLDLAGAAKEYAQVKAAADEAATALAKAKAANDEAQFKLANAPPAIAQDLAKPAAQALVNLRYAEVVHQRARGALQAAERKLAGLARAPRPGSQLAESISLDILPATADSRYRFVLQPVHWPTHDSQFGFSVSRGLLQTASSTVSDRLPEIAINVARTVISATYGIPLGPSSVVPPTVSMPVIPSTAPTDNDPAELGAETSIQPGEPRFGLPTKGVALDELRARRKKKKPTPLWDCRPPQRATDPAFQIPKIELNFDPAYPSSVVFVNCQLQKLGSNVRIQALRWPDNVASSRTHPATKLGPNDGPTVHPTRGGIVYRAPTEYKIAVLRIVSQTGAKEFKMVAIEEVSAVLPNGGPLRVMPMQWALCTTAGYQVQFVDGVPVRQAIDHRSELAECVKIPLEILKTIINAPIDAFDFQTKRAKQEREFIEERRRLDDAKKLPGDGP